MIQFFPSFVGSKKYWIPYLSKYKGKDFVEVFCGSAIISANLARTAVLNDSDFFVYLILKMFDQLVIPGTFTQKEYMEVRSRNDWWLFVYCLQKMSFSGVFRWSWRSGYNVPMKKDIVLDIGKIKKSYEDSKKRWKELNPLVLNFDYLSVPMEYMRNRVVVLDPPYQDSQASYNNDFDYEKYWHYVEVVKHWAETVIVFDRQANLERRNIPVIGKRKMRVNGKHQGDTECLAIFENGDWNREMVQSSLFEEQ